MGLLEFNKLPINTLVGADWKTFNQITAGRTIDPAYNQGCMPPVIYTGSSAGQTLRKAVGR